MSAFTKSDYYCLSIARPPSLLSKKGVRVEFAGLVVKEADFELNQEGIVLLDTAAAIQHGLSLPFHKIKDCSSAQEGLIFKQSVLLLKMENQTTISLGGEKMQPLIEATLRQLQFQRENRTATSFKRKLLEQTRRVQLKEQTAHLAFESLESLSKCMEELSLIVEDVKGHVKEADTSADPVRELLDKMGLKGSKIRFKKVQNDQLEAMVIQVAAQMFSRQLGIVSLVDVYFFVNKLRTRRVSPSDVLLACEEVAKLEGYRLVTLSNKSKFLKSTSFDYRPEQYFSLEVGQSGQDVARKHGLPLLPLQLRVDEWEEAGLIARDERVSGVKYHLNLLNEV